MVGKTWGIVGKTWGIAGTQLGVIQMFGEQKSREIRKGPTGEVHFSGIWVEGMCAIGYRFEGPDGSSCGFARVRATLSGFPNLGCADVRRGESWLKVWVELELRSRTACP